MSLFGKIASKHGSANKAKERLSIMLSHERAQNSLPFMEDMRNDIIEVIKKYTKVDHVAIKSEKNQNVDIIEVEITLGRDG